MLRRITDNILKKRLLRREHPDRLAPQDHCILGHEGTAGIVPLNGCSMASWIAYRLDNTNANARLRGYDVELAQNRFRAQAAQSRVWSLAIPGKVA